MRPRNTSSVAQPLIAELLEEPSLTVTEIAQACQTHEAWVVQRVSHGVLSIDAHTPHGTGTGADPDTRHWRFGSQSLLRARRIRELEHTFDADPELAALTADLIEEVHALRRLLARR